MAAQPFGQKLGPLYPLGALIVAVPGTPILLNQNVPITTDFGTPTSPSYIVFNQLILTAPSSNTGSTYLVFKGGSKNIPSSIVVAIPAGGLFVLASPQLSNIFQASNFAVDADTASNQLVATCVIV